MHLVAVELHSAYHFLDFSIHTYIEITFAAHTLEEFAIVSLALANQRSQQEDGLAGIFIKNHIDDLFFGVFHHLFTAAVAVGCTGTGKEQTEIIVNLGSGTNGRTRVLVGGLLLDADDRTQTGNLIYIRALHIAQEVAGIGRESLYVAALSLGKDGIESQRRLARTRKSGYHGEGVARNLNINILEVVYSCAPYIYLFFFRKLIFFYFSFF